ncbi:hypothetical protein [Maribacter sp. 2307ULW6-5]|uniref:hypothetical protein n=1 Tax=Maribacter sp. 2307ULW6-5 TaxID=3386275 RepID=UPI0039BCE7FB
MAEIRIKKKKTPWGWIVGALVAVGLLAWFFMADTDGAPEPKEGSVVETELGAPTVENGDNTPNGAAANDFRTNVLADPDAQLQAFTAFIGNTEKMGLDHEYTSEALLRLINATIERAIVTGVDVDSELEMAVQRAREITKDPLDGDHADKIKKAYLSITQVMAGIQRQKFPDLSQDIDDVRRAAQDIDPAVLTLDQKEKVNTYFREAADALTKMNPEP